MFNSLLNLTPSEKIETAYEFCVLAEQYGRGFKSNSANLEIFLSEFKLLVGNSDPKTFDANDWAMGIYLIYRWLDREVISQNASPEAVERAENTLANWIARSFSTLGDDDDANTRNLAAKRFKEITGEDLSTLLKIETREDPWNLWGIGGGISEPDNFRKFFENRPNLTNQSSLNQKILKLWLSSEHGSIRVLRDPVPNRFGLAEDQINLDIAKGGFRRPMIDSTVVDQFQKSGNRKKNVNPGKGEK